MRGVPDAVLVVQDVIGLAAVDRLSPLVDDGLNPLPLKRGAVGNVRVIRIVAGDGLIGALQNSVAGVGKPLRVVAGLRAVLGLGETRQLAAVRSEFRDPSDDGHGDQGLSAAGAAVGDEGIYALAG